MHPRDREDNAVAVQYRARSASWARQGDAGGARVVDVGPGVRLGRPAGERGGASAACGSELVISSSFHGNGHRAASAANGEGQDRGQHHRNAAAISAAAGGTDAATTTLGAPSVRGVEVLDAPPNIGPAAATAHSLRPTCGELLGRCAAAGPTEGVGPPQALMPSPRPAVGYRRSKTDCPGRAVRAFSGRACRGGSSCWSDGGPSFGAGELGRRRAQVDLVEPPDQDGHRDEQASTQTGRAAVPKGAWSGGR